MHHTREILRQKLAMGRSHREVARSLGVSVGVVTKVLQRGGRAGLDWAAAELSEDALERLLASEAGVDGTDHRWAICTATSTLALSFGLRGRAGITVVP